MTKRDFVAIAAILQLRLVAVQKKRSNAERLLLTRLATDFADWFERENPRFNRAKFIAAALSPRAGGG